MAVQNLFTAGDLPPASPNEWAETSDRTFGYTVKFAVAGDVTGARVYGPETAPPGTPTTLRIKLFLKSTEALLAAKNFSAAIATSAWTSLNFDTPVAVTANTEYVICYWMDGDYNYCVTAGALTSNKVNGDITGVANEGRFRGDSAQDAYPSQTWTGIFFVDPNFEADSVPITVVVGLASETDTALAVTAASSAAVDLASETDTALAISAQRVKVVDLASETDTALTFAITKSVPVGLASETDTAPNILMVKFVAVGLASETDTALVVGARLDSDAAFRDLSHVYYLNMLAGTIIAGVPSLSAKDAAAVWTTLVKTLELPGMLNVHDGKVLPNYKAIQGVLNSLAGTTNLSVQRCLLILATA